MAMTAAELNVVRTVTAQALSNAGTPVNFTKAQCDAAIQAVETWWELSGTKTALSNAINAATAPLVLTNPQKKKLVAYWLQHKFGKEAV